MLGTDSIPRSASVYTKAGYIHHTFSIRVVFGGFRVYSMGNCDTFWFGVCRKVMISSRIPGLVIEGGHGNVDDAAMFEVSD